MVFDELERVAIGQARATEVSWEPQRHAAGEIERLQLSRIEVDFDRREIVSQLLFRAHADDRDRQGPLLLSSHPRKSRPGWSSHPVSERPG